MVDYFQVHNALTDAVAEYLVGESSAKEWWEEIGGVEIQVGEDEGYGRTRLLIHWRPDEERRIEVSCDSVYVHYE